MEQHNKFEERGALAELQRRAREAAEHAYAPYSGFRVGASLLLANSTVVTGTNVENCSYGLTICAERSAMVRAVSEYGPGVRVLGIAVANLNNTTSPPCGACRQVLSEFTTSDAWISFPGSEEEVVLPFAELFPFQFDLTRSK